MAILKRAALASVLLVAALAPVGAAGTPEAGVKAGLLYNFSRFVTRATASAPANGDLIIGLVGGDPLGQIAGEMVGRRVNDRTIQVTLLGDRDDPRRCHLLFIVDTASDRGADVLQRIGDAPVLTIGESPRFIADGGIVGLYREDGRMRFEINVTRAERAGLKVSSQVLALARIVRLPIASRLPPALFRDPANLGQ